MSETATTTTMADAELPKEVVSMFEGFDDRQLRSMSKMMAIRETRLRFALDHHVNTRGERMDFAHYPHIKALYNSMAFEIVLMGSVQSFKSEWSVIDHFAAAFNGLSVFFVLPKFETRNTYVQNRINRCVENVAEYKKIIGSGFFDSVAMKNFGKGVVKYVGSNVLSDFKEFPADMIYVEEVDQCDAKNVDFALDRIRASHYQFKRYLGNPTNKDVGIHKFYLRSDQREWEVPCLKCGEYAEADWFTTVVEEVTDNSGNIVNYVLRDKDWAPGCRRDILMICPKCGGQLDRISQKGRWVARNPLASMEGYHISQLCSPINPISGMWERFQRGLNDPGLLQQFFNSDLGLPYNAAGNRVTDTVLDRCVDPNYEVAIRPNMGHHRDDACDGPCSMGIDVGQTLDVRISKAEPKGRRRLVFSGKIRALDIDILHELIERYNVEKCVIDAGPELMLATDFQESAQCEVWLCRYGQEGGDKRRQFNTQDRILTIDRTEALDRSYSQLRTRKLILPVNYRDILDGQFVEEMCMPVRNIVEDSKGNSKYEWTKGKDHQRHADTYDMLAAWLMQESIIDDVSVV
jgi:hypothetical protein